MTSYGSVLEKIYYNPGEAGSFGGVEPLFREASKRWKTLTRKNVKEWLVDQEAYTLHKSARVRFKRNKIIVADVDDQWQADLTDMQQLSKYNSGYKYILTAIDVFSRHAWAVALKDKTGAEVFKAFKEIFSGGRVPHKLQTDRGKEFLNKKLSGLLKEQGVHHFVTNNEVKAAVIERFHRTLKSRMWRYFTANNTYRYIDVLPELVKSYNHSFHRTIQARPVDVNSANSLKIWRRVYGSHIRQKEASTLFRKGDHVRVSKIKGTFEKGYEQTFTTEIFIVDEIITRGERPVMRLRDYDGEQLVGGFYPEELQKVNKREDRVYRIEKIEASRTKKKKKYYLVKWLGWPPKFNSWVAAEDVQDIRGYHGG